MKAGPNHTVSKPSHSNWGAEVQSLIRLLGFAPQESMRLQPVAALPVVRVAERDLHLSSGLCIPKARRRLPTAFSLFIPVPSPTCLHAVQLQTTPQRLACCLIYPPLLNAPISAEQAAVCKVQGRHSSLRPMLCRMRMQSSCLQPNMLMLVPTGAGLLCGAGAIHAHEEQPVWLGAWRPIQACECIGCRPHAAAACTMRAMCAAAFPLHAGWASKERLLLRCAIFTVRGSSDLSSGPATQERWEEPDMEYCPERIASTNGTATAGSKEDDMEIDAAATGKVCAPLSWVHISSRGKNVLGMGAACKTCLQVS